MTIQHNLITGSDLHEPKGADTAAVDKVTRLTYDTSIRIVYIPRPENRDLAEIKLKEIAGSFKQFNLPNMNGFELAKIDQNNLQILKRCEPCTLL